MLYSLHEAAYNSATTVRIAARAARDFWGSPLNPASNSKFGRTLYASSEMLSNLTRRYGRPEWGISQVTVKQRPIAVREEVVWSGLGEAAAVLARATDLRAPAALAPALLIVALSGPHPAWHGGDLPAGRRLRHRPVNARDVPIMRAASTST
jgi:poly(3-hydroxybutyrate) depolymerase